MPEKTTLHLFSWNVNGLRAVLRKNALQDFLSTRQPDLLALQEIKCTPAQLTPLELAELETNYQIFWHPATRPGYSGTAILAHKACIASGEMRSSSRPSAGQRAEEEEASARNDGPEELRVATRTIDRKRAFANLSTSEGRVMILELESFYLVNVYTPNSKPDLSRLDLRKNTWDPEFLSLLKSLEKKKPVVTCGDFNAAHKEIDLARPAQNHHHAGFTAEERLGVSNLLAAGFLDTFRLKHPKTARYTWWSHWGKARENNVGWRIDYFFASSALKPNIKSADIHESVLGSDHCPISLALEF